MQVGLLAQLGAEALIIMQTCTISHGGALGCCWWWCGNPSAGVDSDDSPVCQTTSSDMRTNCRSLYLHGCTHSLVACVLCLGAVKKACNLQLASSRTIRIYTGMNPSIWGRRECLRAPCRGDRGQRIVGLVHRRRRRGGAKKSGKKFSGNFRTKFGYFSGKNHVKLGNFVNFFEQIS